ncbi:MAG: hypothetical protein II717_05065 [Lachnospiraceae bacterium]|nr:hypothetical protein [Lachnospiraceae bacterium]
MKFVDLKCPNCGGKLNKNNDSLTCESCGAMFAIDYDESDVEYEKIKLQNLQAIRNSNNVKENEKSNSKFLFIIIAFIAIAIACPIFFILFQRNAMNAFNNAIEHGTVEDKETEISYDVSSDDVKSMLGDFIESGKIIEMNINECANWDGTSAIKNYDKTDAVFESAYLIKDIPNARPEESNRLVIIYKVTWNNENLGDQICYDAVYFEGLQVNPNGGIISDFQGNTIFRSEAAWGWGMAYSFEDINQCYRENVTALGGSVEQIELQ